MKVVFPSWVKCLLAIFVLVIVIAVSVHAVCSIIWQIIAAESVIKQAVYAIATTTSMAAWLLVAGILAPLLLLGLVNKTEAELGSGKRQKAEEQEND